MLMIVMGLAIYFANMQRYAADGHQKYAILCLLAPGIASGLSLAFADSNYWDWSRLDLPSRYLLVIPLFLVLTKCRLSSNLLLISVSLGCLTIGSTSIYQSFALGQSNTSGALGHHIIFGNIAAMLAATVLVLGFMLRHQGRWIPIVTGIAFLSASTATWLSSARGAWLTLLVLIILMPILIAQHKAWLKSLITLAITAIFAAFLYNTPSTNVKQRVDSAVHNIKHYPNPGGAFTSVGARLEMWQTASIIFSEHIVFGSGPRTFNQEGRKLVDKGTVRRFGDNYKHAHNQVLNTLASTGLIGLLALIALNLGPICLAWPYLASRAKTQTHAITDTHHVFATLVLVTSLGFVISGLTESVLDRHAAVMFYLILVSVGLSQLPFTTAPARAPQSTLPRPAASLAGHNHKVCALH